MKRSGSLRRTGALKRGSELVRRKPLRARRRAAGEKAGSDEHAAPSRQAEILRGLQEHWHETVVGRFHEQRGWVGHHVLTQQHLEHHARKLGVPEELLVWDPRNGMAVRDKGVHMNHHMHFRRITRAEALAAAPRLPQFLDAWGLWPLFDREYPA